MTLYPVDSMGALMAQLEAEAHKRGYVSRTQEQYEAMGERANGDAKRNHAQLHMQKYERTHGADPHRAATLVGVDPMASGFWFQKPGDKIF